MEPRTGPQARESRQASEAEKNHENQFCPNISGRSSPAHALPLASRVTHTHRLPEVDKVTRFTATGYSSQGSSAGERASGKLFWKALRDFHACDLPNPRPAQAPSRNRNPGAPISPAHSIRVSLDFQPHARQAGATGLDLGLAGGSHLHPRCSPTPSQAEETGQHPEARGSRGVHRAYPLTGRAASRWVPWQ